MEVAEDPGRASAEGRPRMAGKRSGRKPGSRARPAGAPRRRKRTPPKPFRAIRFRLPDGSVSPAWFLEGDRVPAVHYALECFDRYGGRAVALGTAGANGRIGLPGFEVAVEESRDLVSWSTVDPWSGPHHGQGPGPQVNTPG